MCNAWNHPADCTCGWGGDGHLGKRTDGNQNFNNIRAIYKWIYDSYTVPNARCPVCNACVYFYKSPNGGRVYFDELGPPWPKHPCTDNTKHQYSTPLPNIRPNSFWNSMNWRPIEIYKIPVWKKDGWYPVVVERDIIKSQYAFHLVRISINKRVILKTMIYGSFSTDIMDAEFVFVRRKDIKTILVSTYNVEKKVSDIDELSLDTNILDNFFTD